MTSPENTNDDCLARVTLTITNANLPEDEAKQQALCESLETAVDTILDDATADIESLLGHTYTSVDRVCPKCDSALTLNGIHLREDADAYAVAHCSADCGWTGDSVFSLIDLDKSSGDHHESAVLAGEITPEYQQYIDRDC